MASKSRVPRPHLRHPLPGPGLVHPDPYASSIRPPGGFPSFEMLPPHEVLEQKLSAQHIEIEKLAKENRRLAATHGTLRQDLATAKHELQLVHAHIADMKSEKEHQARDILDKMLIMEAELGVSESVKGELQKARAEAQSLLDARKELISKAQQLTRDIQMAHSEAQQIPSLMSELDSLRQEYHHCRATYEYEKKLYNDHLESLQVMEKNYMAMSREVDRLRAELNNSTNFDPRAGVPYGGTPLYNESIPVVNHASGQSAHGVGQGQSSHLGVVTGGRLAVAGSVGAIGTGGNSPYVVAQSAPPSSGAAHGASVGAGFGASMGAAYDPLRAGHDVQRVPTGPNYDSQRGPIGPGYNGQRGPAGPGYDAQRAPTGPRFDTQRAPSGPGNNAQRGAGATPAYAHQGSTYDGQGAPAYDVQRGSGNEVQWGVNYDAQKDTAYASTAPASRAGNGYESNPHGGNPVRR